MRWELKTRAMERGIATAAAMRRRLAAYGLAVSAGKMSGLWSGTPVTIRLEDLDYICAVLACRPSDLLVTEKHRPPARRLPPAGQQPPDTHTAAPAGRPVPPL